MSDDQGTPADGRAPEGEGEARPDNPAGPPPGYAPGSGGTPPGPGYPPPGQPPHPGPQYPGAQYPGPQQPGQPPYPGAPGQPYQGQGHPGPAQPYPGSPQQYPGAPGQPPSGFYSPGHPGQMSPAPFYPQQEKPAGGGIPGGLGVGCAAIFAAFALAMALASTVNNFLVLNIPSVLAVALGVVLMFQKRWRRFGAGILIMVCVFWIVVVGPCTAILSNSVS